MIYILLTDLPYEGHTVQAFKDEKIARHHYEEALKHTGPNRYNMGCALLKGEVLESEGTTKHELKVMLD